MHLRDSGFKRVPRTSKQEVPGESRYRSSSWTQIIICRTYSVLYAGMRLLYDATQPMLARDSRLLPSTLTLLFACHTVYTSIFCICVRMLRESLRYQRYLHANTTPLPFTLLVYFTTEPSDIRRAEYLNPLDSLTTRNPTALVVIAMPHFCDLFLTFKESGVSIGERRSFVVHFLRLTRRRQEAAIVSSPRSRGASLNYRASS